MKTAAQYADDVRELRAQGVDFPASRGYILADAGTWSRGQKSAVTKAIDQFDFTAFDKAEAAKEKKRTSRPKPKRKPPPKRRPKPKPKRKPKPKPKRKPKPKPKRRPAREQFSAPDSGGGGMSLEQSNEFFDDAVGDALEEWDDIDFFNMDEADEFEDDESDRYTED